MNRVHFTMPKMEPKLSTLTGQNSRPGRVPLKMNRDHSTNPKTEAKQSTLPGQKSICSRVTSNMNRVHSTIPKTVDMIYPNVTQTNWFKSPYFGDVSKGTPHTNWEWKS